MIIACVSLKCSLSQVGYTKSGCREREIVHARCMFHYLEYQRGISVGHLLLLLSEIEHIPSTISFTKIMPASCQCWKTTVVSAFHALKLIAQLMPR
jgi:hypothetical protein